MLTDFGLAKDVASESKVTRSGMALGTPAYMPPEQARGEVEGLDERADVFSLGAILHELLSGEPPFTGESDFDVMEAIERYNEIDCRAMEEILARLRRGRITE